MSQQPVYYAPTERSNSLGIAGFVVSLVGLISCGVLSPVGLILSAVAIFRRPRGFALAGIILGLIGCIAWVIALICGLLGLIAAGLGIAAAAPTITTELHMAQVAQVVATHKAADGTFPTDLASLSELSADDRQDAWGHPLRVLVKGPGEFQIVSDGPDGIAGTSDDLQNEGSSGGDHPRVKRKRHRPQVD